MKIAKITAEVKYIELKTPFKTALRETSHVEFVRVHVEDENGLVGIGEAPATKAITGEDIEIILNSIKSVQDVFMGLTCQESLTILHSKCNIGSSAASALDMAFISLHVKEQNQTLIEYFNTKDLSPLKTDVTISLNDSDMMIEDAKKAFKDDMSILKVKLASDISHAIKVVKSISNELPLAEIIVDANQAWSLKDSLEFIEAMKNIKIELIEQPVGADDLSALKIISDMSHIPILADESVFTLEDAKKVVESKSAHMINIKLMKCGGVTKAIEILEYAREKEVTCMLGSMLEGPTSINIALYLAMAYRDVIKYIDLDSPLLYKEASDELDFTYRGFKIIKK
ncbi:MAG: dipeptide epimerase [Sulfurimonas sp.]|uniref:dipeptide epimerase n=1 Tax=Sulfurimonas sp. TaxID=2022749 RepID=UPI00260AE1C4|nr:dipeptide epimerase [Sulfurimonas sp.]MCW8895742.1 dipeptide epimerase [Sulfurimonas sp.]MCW8953305.1 dipeptide epimerase [Sulfurimonas sp.]MCW9067480.1 dipeptide epimerase [Sulfurimonas sp.]